MKKKQYSILKLIFVFFTLTSNISPFVLSMILTDTMEVLKSQNSITCFNKNLETSAPENWFYSNLEYRKRIEVTTFNNEWRPIFMWNFSLNDILEELNILGQVNDYTFRLVEIDSNGNFIRELPYKLNHQHKYVIFNPEMDSNGDGLSNNYTFSTFSKRNETGGQFYGIQGVDYDFWISDETCGAKGDFSQGVWLTWTEGVTDEDPPNVYEGAETFYMGELTMNIPVYKEDFLDFWYKIDNVDARIYMNYKYRINGSFSYDGTHRFDCYNNASHQGQWLHFRENLFDIIRTNPYCYSGDYDYPNPNRPHSKDSTIELTTLLLYIQDTIFEVNKGYTTVLFDEVSITSENISFQFQYPELFLANQPHYFEIYFDKCRDLDSRYIERIDSFMGENIIKKADVKINSFSTEWNGGGHSFLLEASPDMQVWTTPSTEHVFKNQKPPIISQEKLEISAAKNEPESFQLIINAKGDIEDIELVFTDLTLESPIHPDCKQQGELGEIPKESFTVKKVEYVPVTSTTDLRGELGLWPDPLPPLVNKFNLSSNESQSLWITVRSPSNICSGNYTGTIQVKYDKGQKSLDINLLFQIFDFKISDESYLRSAFGMSWGYISQFHGLTSENEKRLVLDYYQNYFKYLRIEPQNNYETYDIPVEYCGHTINITNGPLNLFLNNLTSTIFSISQKGNNKIDLGFLETCIKQHEGSTDSWPRIDYIKNVSVTVGPVLVSGTIVGVRDQKSTSTAQRNFEITLDFRIASDQPYFQVRITKIRNTDPSNTYQVQSYFHLIDPALDGDYSNDDAYNYDPSPPPTEYSFWKDPFGYISGIENNSIDFSLNFWRSGDSYHGDISKAVPGAPWLNPNDEVMIDGPWITILGNSTTTLAEIETECNRVYNHIHNPLQVSVGSYSPPNGYNYTYNGYTWEGFYPIIINETASLNRDYALVQIPLSSFSGLNPSIYRKEATRLVDPNKTPENGEIGGHYIIFQIDDTDNDGQFSIDDTLIFQTNITALGSKTFHLYFSSSAIPADPDYWGQTSMSYDEVDTPHAYIDFTEFQKWGKLYLDELDMKSFKLPFPRIDSLESIGNYPIFSTGYNVSFISHLTKLCDALRNHGWLNKAYYYIFDEPRIVHITNITRIAQLCRQAAPDLKILLTEEIRDELLNIVNIWVPLTDKHQIKKSTMQLSQGNEIWWYVCCNPRAPYANLFIDEPAIDHRILLWSTFVHNITGFLYWNVNYWYNNPWTKPMSISSTTGSYWGNGDGTLFYPPNNTGPSPIPLLQGPISSIRAELLREGIEDYDYFCMLSNLTIEVEKLQSSNYIKEINFSNSLINYIQEVSMDLTNYLQSSALLRNLRQKVASHISKLINILNISADNPLNEKDQLWVLIFLITIGAFIGISFIITAFKLVKKLKLDIIVKKLRKKRT